MLFITEHRLSLLLFVVWLSNALASRSSDFDLLQSTSDSLTKGKLAEKSIERQHAEMRARRKHEEALYGGLLDAISEAAEEHLRQGTALMEAGGEAGVAEFFNSSADQGLRRRDDDTCLFECGASELHVTWQMPKSNAQNQIKFTVGQGTDIKYSPKESECLSDCFVVDYSAGGARRCGYFNKQYKVAKAEGFDGGGETYKLCCYPKKCNYLPETKQWVRPEVSGGAGSDYKPLTDLNDVEEVGSHTCLCCNRQKEYVAWGYEVRDYCKLAYMPSTLGSLGKSALRFFSVTLSSRLMAGDCQQYCSKYPDHKYAKFSLSHQYLTGANEQRGITETGAALEYQKHCLDDVIRISANAGRLSPSVEIPSHKFESSAYKPWDRIIGYYTQYWPDKDYKCTIRYRLECPKNDDDLRRAAISEYKSCCNGEDCRPEKLKSERSDGFQSSTWLTADTPWERCISQNENIRLYTNVQLKEGSSEFSKGAQLVGLQAEGKGCLEASISAQQHMLTESYEKCPIIAQKIARGLFDLDFATNHAVSSWIFGKNPDVPKLADYRGMFDKYTAMMYGLMVHLSLRTYSESFAKANVRMGVPHMRRALNKLRSYEVSSPTEEIDKYDGQISGLLLPLTKSCAFLIARSFRILDDVGDAPQGRGENEWSVILSPGESRAALLQKFFEPYKNAAGEPVYPAPSVDYMKIFKSKAIGPGDVGPRSDKNLGTWDDTLETHLAFEAIGTFRTRQLAEPISSGGETAVFSLDLKGFNALKLRDPDFGNWGAEMFFNKDGVPLMVKFNDHSEIWKHKGTNEQWQYAKFVWRSTLINSVTLIDHLWFTHFYVANRLAVTARELMAPDHPLRRLMSMFSWGTPGVNQGASHQLAGAKAMLHRMTPFRDFGEVSSLVMQLMPTFGEYFETFTNDAAFEQVPELLKKSPFYVDGRDLFKIISDFVDGFFDVYESDWCAGDTLYDRDLLEFLDTIVLSQDQIAAPERTRKEALWFGFGQQHNATRTSEWKSKCSGVYRKLMKVTCFAVTGWHRHVGTVADLMRDPELTSPSWVKGHRYAQPRQAMQAALIAATTGFTNPKIGDNHWSFMFEGIKKEAMVRPVVEKYESDLAELVKKVDERNKERSVPYLHMHPMHVENSVAV